GRFQFDRNCLAKTAKLEVRSLPLNSAIQPSGFQMLAHRFGAGRVELAEAEIGEGRFRGALGVESVHGLSFAVRIP
ncbi:MAG TPA: hypothetical protein PK867_18540, partial [Pirellulales bacterium]|nr:hypothetical protein [Pirellulales bacterium]